jgi:hypothetical protein
LIYSQVIHSCGEDYNKETHESNKIFGAVGTLGNLWGFVRCKKLDLGLLYVIIPVIIRHKPVSAIN